jgi:DUF4097 and DUF4098 domain-containing protein YvlB
MISLKPLFTSILLLLLTAGLFAAGDRESELIDEFSYRGVDELEIDTSFFDVTVESHPGDEIEIAVYGPDSQKVVHKKRGDRLTVETQKKFGLFPQVFQGKAQIIVKAPRETELEISCSSGSIEIRNMQSYELKLASSSGRVSIFQSEGSINATTSSGNIILESAKGNLEISSSSGSIHIVDSSGILSAASSSGNIEIQNYEGTLELQSSSGDISGGNIRITENSFFSTSSGWIEMDFYNKFLDFSFDLMSSSGGLQVGTIQAEKILKTGDGPILITGKTSSGDIIFKAR